MFRVGILFGCHDAYDNMNFELGKKYENDRLTELYVHRFSMYRIR